MRTATKIALLTLSAGASAAVLLWRNQQVRDQARQAFDTAKSGLSKTGLPQWQQESGGTGQMSAETVRDPLAGAGATELQPTPLSVTGPDIPRPATNPAPASAPVAPSDTISTGSTTLFSTTPDAPVQDRVMDVPGLLGTQEDMMDSPAQPSDIERSARPGQNAATDKLDRTLLEVRDMARRDDSDAGQLEAYGDDETITDRVRTNIGRELRDENLPHLNINTQENGVVYLRGYVHSQDQRELVQIVVEATEGVREVVNELTIEHEASS